MSSSLDTRRFRLPPDDYDDRFAQLSKPTPKKGLKIMTNGQQFSRRLYKYIKKGIKKAESPVLTSQFDALPFALLLYWIHRARAAPPPPPPRRIRLSSQRSGPARHLVHAACSPAHGSSVVRVQSKQTT
eukprot:6211099-Pleurochrysis_carterae.AAC.2